MAEMTPRERLEALRSQQGAIDSQQVAKKQSQRERLNELRAMDGDSSGGGQGDTPSNNPVFEAARNNGFLKGYLDQAAGIVQILDKFKDTTSSKVREVEGMKNPDAQSIDEFINQEENIYQKNRPKNGDEGFDWTRLAGNIASPVTFATAKVPVLGGYKGRLATGASMGAISAGTQPVSNKDLDYWQTKAVQAGGGAVAGAAAVPVISAIRGVIDFGKNLVGPLSEKGMMREIKELYIGMVGDSRDKIVKALDNARTYIPGNKPTSAQAIAEGQGRVNYGGSIAKMERSLAKQPATGDVMKTTLSEQTANRADAVKGMINASDNSLASAIEQRTLATAQHYKAVEASNKLVRVNNVLKQVRTTISKHRNEPDVTVPLNKILGALKQGDILETNPQNLYSLSKAIKRMIETKNVGGANEYNVSVLSSIKKTLDKQIGKAEPEFAKAQNVFKEYSKPINQMEVTREFGKALESSLKEERATPFVNAMNDAVKTLKKSTGFARFKKLSDVMEPEQVKILNQVKSELIRESKKKKLATGTSGGIEGLQRKVEPGLPNLLSRPVMMTNFILKRIGMDMSPAYEKLAIRVQQDPKLLADLLRRPAENKERKMIIELFQRYTEMIPVQTLSREATIE